MMEDEIKKYLNDIIGSKVTYSRAGGGAGSIISMDISNKDIRG
jgi:hypothetical protein